MSERLTATPETCFWGYLTATSPRRWRSIRGPRSSSRRSPITPASARPADGRRDDRDLERHRRSRRAPGVHIMTGPIHVRSAEPGDTLRVELLDMRPRLPYGSNCAANWGLFHEIRQGAHHDLRAGRSAVDRRVHLHGTADVRLRLHRARAVRHPGVISEPDPLRREPFGRAVEVPVRPHLGVMGVAPILAERRSSIPPGVFGGNVDNWRFGPGATVHYPVFTRAPVSTSAIRTSRRVTARSAARRSRRRWTSGSGSRSPTTSP